MRDGGHRQRTGAGLTALRQRPAPVRCRAKAAGQAAAQRCRGPPSLAPAAGLPLVPLASLSGDPRRCSDPCRSWPPGAPVGRALEAVEKVVTRKKWAQNGIKQTAGLLLHGRTVHVGIVYWRISVSPGMTEI